MSKTPASKSQTRALALAGLPVAAGYYDAATALETAGLRRDGIPASMTWRDAARIADVELLSAIALPADRYEDTSIEY